MKKNLLAIILSISVAGIIVIPSISNAQVTSSTRISQGLKSVGDTSWVINTLRAPSSPGASLIGISPSSIQRPTDPSAFTASLLNATNNFSAIPNSYAVDFAPAWLFAGQHISYTDFQSDKVGKNLWQSLDISFAFKNIKDSLTNISNITMGLGIKVSFFRGTINSKANSLVDQTYQMLSNLVKAQTVKRNQYIKTHPSFSRLRDSLNTVTDTAKRNLIIARLSATIDSLNSVVNVQLKSSLDSIKKIGETINFARYGWKLDLAGGMSYYFPNQSTSGSSLNNAGAWLTGGYEDENNNISFLGILRYLYNPKEAYADPTSILKQNNLSTFDTGMRLLFDTKDSKFTFGGEIIYRSILNNDMVKPSFRYTITTDYQVGKNQLISFALGRDFDGKINKGGNLLAALNFIIGFGNTKSIKPN